MKTAKVYRACSGNSYIVEGIVGDKTFIFFPFVNIRGLHGSLPTKNQINDIYLGEIEIKDNKPVFEDLISLTGGE